MGLKNLLSVEDMEQESEELKSTAVLPRLIMLATETYRARKDRDESACHWAGELAYSMDRAKTKVLDFQYDRHAFRAVRERTGVRILKLAPLPEYDDAEAD